MAAPSVRRATSHDAADIHRLLVAFGALWNRPEWVTGTPAALEAALFGPDPKGFAHVALVEDAVVGVALWYMAFNFWMATPVLYLEDLFVDASARDSGAGETLLRALAAEAVDRDCGWMEWIVPSNNIAGKRFYARHGASNHSDYELWRMERDALNRLAGHD